MGCSVLADSLPPNLRHPRRLYDGVARRMAVSELWCGRRVCLEHFVISITCQWSGKHRNDGAHQHNNDGAASWSKCSEVLGFLLCWLFRRPELAGRELLEGIGNDTRQKALHISYISMFGSMLWHTLLYPEGQVPKAWLVDLRTEQITASRFATLLGKPAATSSLTSLLPRSGIAILQVC